MASISRPRTNGNYRVEYYVGKEKDGFMLPTKSKTAARSIADMIQRLIDWRKHKEPDKVLFQWLENLPDDLRERLEKKELIERQHLTTIGQAVEAYIDSKKASWKPITISNRNIENKHLFDYFKPNTPLKKIDRQSAVKFMNWLKDVRMLSPQFINKILKWATSIYKYAILCGDFTSNNPFTGVRVPDTVQRTKQYISIEYTEKLIEACPTVQWRTAIAMLRYGGMRPEEILLAEWDGVDWEAGTFTFRSPKTEHHEGKGQRTIPLFPRLREAFEEMRMAAEMETGIILPQYILSTEKPGNGWDSKRQSIAEGKRISLCEMSDFIKTAKLDNPGSVPTNMRGSCSSDLKRQYPEYAVDAWLGHAKEIARRHYDVVHQDLFEQAAKTDVFISKNNRCDKCCDVVAINSTTKEKQFNENYLKDSSQVLENKGFLQVNRNDFPTIQEEKISLTGVEPIIFASGGRRHIH